MTTQTLPAWCAGYVGIPFADRGRTREGLDCWGLVWMVLSEQFREQVPSYVDRYETVSARKIISDVMTSELKHWRPVCPGDRREGDVVLLRIHAAAWHAGVYLGGGMMIHTHQGVGTVIEPIDGPVWSRRLMGVYRNAG